MWAEGDAPAAADAATSSPSRCSGVAGTLYDSMAGKAEGGVMWKRATRSDLKDNEAHTGSQRGERPHQ